MLNLYNGKEQKEHIDETLEDYLAEHGFEQSFKSEFIFLGLQYSAVLVSLYVYYLENTTSFADSKWFVGSLCLVYYAFQLLAYLWHTFVEKNAAYIGVQKSTGRKVVIKTENPTNTPEYVVTVYIDNTSTKLHFQLNELVDHTGMVHPEELTPLLALVNKKVE